MTDRSHQSLETSVTTWSISFPRQSYCLTAFRQAKLLCLRQSNLTSSLPYRISEVRFSITDHVLHPLDFDIRNVSMVPFLHD